MADDETPDVTTGALVPQPHGGSLRRGGTNRGGPGRPASAIRARLRGSFAKRIKIIEEIAGDEEASRADRMKAVELLAKYGLGLPPQQVEHSGPDGGPIPTRVEILVRRPEEESRE